jgi:hypothetical protein
MLRRPLPAVLAAAAALTLAHASDLDTIGLTTLLASHPELTGSGQIVAQAEADVGGGAFEVNPTSVGLPSSTFTYYNSAHPYSGGASYDSSLVSSHATEVGSHLYGATTGVAPGVSAVQNFEASYFLNSIVVNQTQISAPIVNQSFVVSSTDASTIASVSRSYDAYANRYGTLFVNGLNNGSGSTTNAPAAMFNGIAVGRMDGSHSGRAQIVAPGSATSFATPYVTGAAVVLRQAAVNGDFGALSGTNATDSRLLKAGILNGATKTDGWSHTSTDPLDATYGSGVLNVNASYNQLAGGQHACSVSSTTSLGTISTSTAFKNALPAAQGWDLQALSPGVSKDTVAHYFFDLGSTSGAISLTATLTWNSIANTTLGTDSFNNFDLVLVNSTTGGVAWSSVSTDENVEQIYLTDLAGAKYDLQVILRGGRSALTSTDAGTYALVWSWTSLTAVPESDRAWLIGALGFAFILAKQIRRRRA